MFKTLPVDEGKLLRTRFFVELLRENAPDTMIRFSTCGKPEYRLY